MRGIPILLLCGGLVSCASKRAALDLGDDEKVNPAFEKGLKALEREDYAGAANIFDHLLVAKPGTQSDLVTTFNSGAAHEGLGHCAKAADRYREVVRASAGKYRLLEGTALFRLSLAYECLGQDTKAITALLDARKRGKELPPETRNAEIPARLAAAYARIGNKDKALQYFNEASEGLKRFVKDTPDHRQKEMVARTLYLMGQLNPAQRDATIPPATFLQSLSMQQPYLLQSVEMDHPQWSKKAADDLILAYDNIWKFKFDDLETQRGFYTRGLQVIQELRKIRLPNAIAAVNAIYDHLGVTEGRLQAELASNAELNHLTPAAEQREGLRRQGRLADPQPAKKSKAKR